MSTDTGTRAGDRLPEIRRPYDEARLGGAGSISHSIQTRQTPNTGYIIAGQHDGSTAKPLVTGG